MRFTSRKGFFFVLISFILLSYILISTYSWVRAIETSERTYSDAFRASSLTTLAEQVSEQRVDRYADMAAHYTLYKLVNYSVGNELLDERGDEYSHIRAAYFELLSNCTTGAGHFLDNTVPPASYSAGEAETYCFRGFLGQLNSSLSNSGFEVESFSLSNFSLNETAHPLELEMNLTLYLRIKDLQTDTSINRTYHISRIVNATGMMDPLLARQSIRQLREGALANATIYKGMYLYPSDLPFGEAHTEFYPQKRGQGSAGQGWFYGNLILAEDAGRVREDLRDRAILIGNYSDIISVQDYQGFGAYIQTDAPERSQTECGTEEFDTFNAIDPGSRDASGRCPDPVIKDAIEQPFVVYEDFMDDVYGDAYGPGSFRYILFVAQSSYTEVLDSPDEKDNPVFVYDVEKLRDFTRCSYYVVHADAAPSFLQRLLVNGYERTSPIGLETLVVGRWAGGADNPGWNDYSRVDREFFGNVEGEKIRGMPGCKDWYMCADRDALVSDVGSFRLGTPESTEFYLGTSDTDDENYIGCDDEKASCEEP
ncbi:MAG: hypothetical protein AB1657_01405 [Candidatus Micrarchaeota archaeon]